MTRPPLHAAIVLLEVGGGAVDCCCLCPFAELATSQSLSLIGHIERVKTPSRGQGQIKGRSTGRGNKEMLRRPCCYHGVPQWRRAGVSMAVLVISKDLQVLSRLK